jgi:hypothetical protein
MEQACVTRWCVLLAKRICELMFDTRLPSRDLIADSIEAVCDLRFLFHALTHHTLLFFRPRQKQVTLVRRRGQDLGAY